MFSIDSTRLKVALATAGLLVLVADRDTGMQQALTREAVEQHLRALYSVWATGDPVKILAAAEPQGAGFGLRSLAPRTNRPRDVEIEELRSFFNRVEYWRANLDELHTAVDGDVGLAWGFHTEDFKVRGREPEKVRVRFTLTLKKEATGWRHLLFHRDVQQFDEKGRYVANVALPEESRASGTSRSRIDSGRQTTAEIERQIVDNERTIAASFLKHDPSAAQRFFADDFREIVPSGRIFTKADMVREAANSDFIQMDIFEPSVHVVKPDVAIYTARYVETRKQSPSAEPVTRNVRLLVVWILRNGKWQIVAGQNR